MHATEDRVDLQHLMRKMDATAPEHAHLWQRYVPCYRLLRPDRVWMPDGKPHLYRWHIVPLNNDCGNLFFHIQVSADPHAELHDHPWWNQSVVLAGGYDEIYQPDPANDGPLHQRSVRAGDVVHRQATEAHRLQLPPGAVYSMSLFTTGPKVRDWGFWYPDGWRVDGGQGDGPRIPAKPNPLLEGLEDLL